MMGKRAVLLALAAVLGTSMSAEAQGTYPNGVRGGYAGSAPVSASPTTSSPPPSPAYPAPATRNLGTGQGRSEGAMGMTPQMQKELGITRQQ